MEPSPETASWLRGFLVEVLGGVVDFLVQLPIILLGSLTDGL